MYLEATFPLERLLTFTALHGVISQTIEIFIPDAVKTSNDEEISGFCKRIALVSMCFVLVPCLAYSSALKMESFAPPQRHFSFNGLHDFISQKIKQLLCEPHILDTRRILKPFSTSPGVINVHYYKIATI